MRRGGQSNLQQGDVGPIRPIAQASQQPPPFLIRGPLRLSGGPRHPSMIAPGEAHGMLDRTPGRANRTGHIGARGTRISISQVAEVPATAEGPSPNGAGLRHSVGRSFMATASMQVAVHPDGPTRTRQAFPRLPVTATSVSSKFRGRVRAEGPLLGSLAVPGRPDRDAPTNGTSVRSTLIGSHATPCAAARTATLASPSAPSEKLIPMVVSMRVIPGPMCSATTTSTW